MTTRVLGMQDLGAYFRISAAGAVIQIPTHSTAAIPVRTRIEFVLTDAAADVTFEPAVGVTVNAPAGLSFSRLGTKVELLKVGKLEWDLNVATPGTVIVSGVGEPTRSDLDVGSLYVREDEGQLWQQTQASGLPAKAAICFAIDIALGAPTQLGYVQAGVNAALDALLAEIVASGAVYDLSVTAWGSASHATSTLTKRAASSSDVTALKAFVTALTGNADRGDPRDGAGAINPFFDGTTADFAERYCFWLSDGDNGLTPSPTNVAAAEATLRSLECVRVYSYLSSAIPSYPSGLASLEAFDNTPADGVPGPPTSSADVSGWLVGQLESNTYGWRRLSIIAEAQANGVAVAGVKALNFGSGLSAQTSACGVMTVSVPNAFSSLPAADNDAGAASAGVAVGGLYRNGSVVQVRVT